VETTTDERTTGATVDETPEPAEQPDTTPDPGEGDTPVAPGEGETEGDTAESEAAAFEEEQRAEEERQKALADAKDQLSFPIGGIRPAKAMFQVTGGEIEIPAHLMPDKDEEMTIAVTGWVKTIKDTTEKKGLSASRTAVFVVEDIDLQKLSS
jgi:hypothetical protein